MTIRISIGDGICKLGMPKRFDFALHRGFRDAYTPMLLDGGIKKFLIDFSETEYLDSAALGLLLLVRRQSKEAGKAVSLSGVHGVVAEVLHIAKFDTLFD